MNPEFVRNVWLELTPRRLTLMTVVLALAFFAAALSGGVDYRPAAVAKALYYFIVVFWGARNAALSVVGEIRERTWDSQRLSALGAGAMVWGKLFGSTIYNWYGGAICLAVIAASDFVHQGPFAATLDVVYFVAIGVIVQAVSLLASLAAIRRRQRHTGFELFIYQLVGILAAVAVFCVWDAADPEGFGLIHKKATDVILWWGVNFDARPFLLASLAIFAGWTLLGCYREMRLELKMRNGPLVWAAFLVFMGVYVAGFDAWLKNDAAAMNGWSNVALRLMLATTTFGVLTYIMVLLEPKDRVLYRWLGGQLARGRFDRFVSGLQAWMMSYLATVAAAVAVIVWVGTHGTNVQGDQALLASGLAFVTRDVAIFVLFETLPGRRRGDFGAIVVLIALYGLVPAILDGLDLKSALAFFYPQPTEPLWLGPAVAWGEAGFAILLALGRLALGEKDAAEPVAA